MIQCHNIGNKFRKNKYTDSEVQMAQQHARMHTESTMIS